MKKVMLVFGTLPLTSLYSQRKREKYNKYNNYVIIFHYNIYNIL